VSNLNLNQFNWPDPINIGQRKFSFYFILPLDPFQLIPKMSKEKFCLKWDDFQNNINLAFGSLREDNDFTDVTLACEDGNQMEAHKVVLSASSAFFQNLLRMNKHPHPLIYMRGIRSEDLKDILDFMYHGEANIYKDNLETFLAIGEELNMTGLAGESNLIESFKTTPDRMKETANTALKSNVQTVPILEMFTIKEDESLHQPPTFSNESTHQNVTNLNKTEPVQNGANYEEIDAQIKSLMKLRVVGQGKVYECAICGKQTTTLRNSTNLKIHIESKHLQDISFSCNNCDRVLGTRVALKQHYKRHHANIV
jgi:hypothetical protein